MKNYVELSPELSFLIIDESPAVRDNLSNILKQIGYRNILQSSDGPGGILMLKREKIGFVFCNRNLRTISGLEVLKEYRENMAITSVPFVLVASEISKSDVLIGTEIGMDSFLKIPFVAKEVSQKIVQVMKEYYSPDSTQLMFEMAREIYAQGDFESSCQQFSELASKFPKSCRARLGMGRCYVKLEKFDKAEASFREAISINDIYVHAYHELGVMYVNQNKIEYAMAAFDKAIKISPLNPVRYETMGELLLERNLFEQAENYLLRAVELELVYPNIYAQLGKALLSQKKTHKASRFFERALLAEPHNISYLNSYGICLKDLGKFEQAIECYNKAFKLNPADMKVLFNKAICLIAAKDYPKAIRVLNQVLATDPNNEKALAKLKWLTQEMSKSA